MYLKTSEKFDLPVLSGVSKFSKCVFLLFCMLTLMVVAKPSHCVDSDVILASLYAL
jgi:hypothetical protein